MKTKITFAVLSVVVLGCRETYTELCPGEYHIATAVAIEGGDEDGASAVPVGDLTNTDAYKLLARVINGRGMDTFRDVEWQVVDSDLAHLATINADPVTYRDASAIISTLSDILDQDGTTEPETTLRVCATNDCTNYLGGSGCAPCVPEVCSAPLTIRAVINAEGEWLLEGATFPFATPLHVSQAGRKLEAGGFEPEIHGRTIEFWSWEIHYIGEFTDHEHVTGEVTNDATGENLGVWTATKCPDTGCVPPEL
jgi:hypothetical protein